MTTAMSWTSRNPFRTPVVSPNPTGASSVSSPPPAFSSTDNVHHLPARDTASSDGPDTNPGLEEAPPAYTPSADVYQGEATVQYGPHRPFQQAPPPPALPPHLSPQATGQSYMTAQATGSSQGWARYPGQAQMQMQRHVTGTSNFAPPPRHPLSRNTTGASAGGRPAPPARPLSEFARDFYDTGPSEPAEPVVLEPPQGSTLDETARYQPPSFAPPSPYAPPSEPPPPERASGAPGRNVADNGKPTANPTPGHPLLNKGRVLVYPTGYECGRCHNTGYRNLDPSHPCDKCWGKHAKAYGGALLYAPWESASTSAPSSSSTRSNFQRPLPAFRPPHRSPTHAHSHSHSALSMPAQAQSQPTLLRSRSVTRPGCGSGSGYPGAMMQQQPQLGWTDRAPPGALVVQPGDPRIGGRLCWRCEGEGVVSFMIFDTETCPACRGMGRIVG